mgnify:CR=1 FL=1
MFETPLKTDVFFTILIQDILPWVVNLYLMIKYVEMDNLYFFKLEKKTKSETQFKKSNTRACIGLLERQKAGRIN